MQVVKINQRTSILVPASGSGISGIDGNAGLGLGGGSSQGGRSRDYDDWDEE